MSKDRKSFLGARDSRSGQFVTLQTAKERPSTTQKEHIPLPGNGTEGKKGGSKG